MELINQHIEEIKNPIDEFFKLNIKCVQYMPIWVYNNTFLIAIEEITTINDSN